MLEVNGSKMRNVGIKDFTTGQKYGGTYYPATQTSSARFETQLVEEGRAYTDAQGNVKESEPKYHRIVIWNSKNSQVGKGMADYAARYLSIGKEIKSFKARQEVYESKIYENGVPVQNPDGTFKTRTRVKLVIRSIEYGRDAEAQIKREIAAWNGEMNPISRPPFWDGKVDLMSGIVVPINPNSVTTDGFAMPNMEYVQNCMNIWQQLEQMRKIAMPDMQTGMMGYAKIHTGYQTNPVTNNQANPIVNNQANQVANGQANSIVNNQVNPTATGPANPLSSGYANPEMNGQPNNQPTPMIAGLASI